MLQSRRLAARRGNHRSCCMSGVFTGDEVLQIAMEMEETGQVFYEAIAAGCGNDAVAAFCRRLSEQEGIHYRRFKQMREDLADPNARTFGWDELDQAQALINERVVPDPAEATRIAAGGRMRDMLDLAVLLESDSIRFYAELAEAAGPEHEPVIRSIIDEERSHEQELRAVRAGLK